MNFMVLFLKKRIFLKVYCYTVILMSSTTYSNDLLYYNEQYKPHFIGQLLHNRETGTVDVKRVMIFVGEQTQTTKDILNKISSGTKLTSNEISAIKLIFSDENVLDPIAYIKSTLVGKQVINGGSNNDDINSLIEMNDTLETSNDTETDMDFSFNGSSLFGVSYDTPVTDVKVSTTVSRAVNFVYDYINGDDNINDIKKKIYINSSVNSNEQHLFVLDTDLNGVTSIYTPEYSIINAKRKRIKYNVNILNLFKEYKTLKGINLAIHGQLIADTPIDNEFLRAYTVRRQYRIVNNSLRNDIYKHNSVLFMVDIHDIVSLKQIRLLSRESLNIFINGFVIKYYPALYNEQLIVSALEPVSDISHRTTMATISKQLNDTQFMLNLLNGVPINAVKEYADTARTMLTSINAHINGNSPIIGMRLIIPRNLIEFMETDDRIPCIRYKDTYRSKMVYKIQKSIALSSDIQNWIKYNPNGVSLKVRMSGDIFSHKYTRFAGIDIRDDGFMNLHINWKEENNVSFDIINDIVSTVDYTIDKLNSVSKHVFISNNRIPVLSSELSRDIRFLTINISFAIDFIITKDVYIVLRSLLSVFNSLVTIDYDSKVTYLFDNVNRITMNYLRSPKRPNGVSLYTNNEYVTNKDVVTTTEGIIVSIICNHDIKTINNEINRSNMVNTVRGVVDSSMIADDNIVTKITIKGAHSIDEMKQIYTFVLKMLCLAKFTVSDSKQYGSSGEYLGPLHDHYKNVYKQNTMRFNDNIGINPNRRGVSNINIRKLQEYDPKLFSAHLDNKQGKQYTLYSKLCQSHQQPIVVSNSERNKYNPESVLDYRNFTYPNVKNVYICNHPVLKYPGFLTPDKHPSGYCMPCCFKRSRMMMGTKGYRKYMQCVNNVTLNTEHSKVKYTLQYGKLVPDGRIGQLPPQLELLLNDKTKDIKSKHQYIYKLLGVEQNSLSFLNSVAVSLGYNPTDYINELLSNIEELYNRSSIRYEHKYDTFMDIIMDDTIVGHSYLMEIVNLYNVSIGHTHSIIVITEYNRGNESKIVLNCGYFNTNDSYIVILNYRNWYIPVIKIWSISSNNALKNAIKVYTNSDTIINVINTIYSKQCTETAQRVTYAEKYKGVSRHLSVAELIDSIKDTSYNIVSQTLVNSVVQSVTIKNDKIQFQFKVRDSQPIKNVPINYDDIQLTVSVQNLLKFIETVGIIKATKLLVYNGNIIGIQLDTNYIVYTERTPYNSKQELQVVLQVVELDYDPYVIQEKLEKHDNSNSIMTLLNNYRRNKDILSLLKLELITFIKGERNTQFRKDLIKAIRNNTIMELLTQYTLSNDDITQLKTLYTIYITSNSVTTNIDVIIDGMIFNIDSHTSSKIKTVIDKERLNMLNSVVSSESSLETVYTIIDELLFKTVIFSEQVSSYRKAEIHNNIHNICSTITSKDMCNSTRSLCMWTPSAQCKFVMSRDLYIKCLNQISNEILYNSSISETVLSGIMTIITDINKYNYNDTFESVFTTDIENK